jgi:hypothetical protein
MRPDEDRPTEPPKPYRVKVFRGGLRPGVNLDSNADTLDLMEGLPPER